MTNSSNRTVQKAGQATSPFDSPLEEWQQRFEPVKNRPGFKVMAQIDGETI